MRTRVIALPSTSPLDDIRRALNQSHGPQGQQLYPILDSNGALCGALTRGDLMKAVEDSDVSSLAEIAEHPPAVVHPDESLRAVVYRMAESGLTRFLVTDRENKTKLLGILSLEDLLRARTRNLHEERTRERVLRIRVPFLGRPVMGRRSK